MANLTAEKTEVKSAPKQTGKIAIIWNPDRDKDVPDAPTGSVNERPCLFDWVNIAEVEAIRKMREELDPFKAQMLNPVTLKGAQTLRLNPGINWIEIELWEAAKAESTRRSVSGERHDSRDYLQRLIDDRAITVLSAKGGNLTGTIADYSVEEARQIIETISDMRTLMEYQSLSKDAGISSLLADRMEKLQGRF